MINNVVLVGRLTKDPELRYTPSGIPMARFTIAVNRTFTSQSGEREADFIGCIAWRKPAENLANFMKKGSLIGVEGRIQTGSYDGQDGKKIYTTDVIADAIQFLEPRGDGQAPQPQQEQPPRQQQQQPQYEQQYSNPQAAQQAGQQAHQQQYQQPPQPQQYQQPQQRTSDDDLPY